MSGDVSSRLGSGVSRDSASLSQQPTSTGLDRIDVVPIMTGSNDDDERRPLLLDQEATTTKVVVINNNIDKSSSAAAPRGKAIPATAHLAPSKIEVRATQSGRETRSGKSFSRICSMRTA